MRSSGFSISSFSARTVIYGLQSKLLFLLMKFFNVSARKFFHSIQISGSNLQKVFLSRPFGNLETGISALASPLESALASTLQKNYFCVQNFFFLFFEKMKYLCSFICLVMASVPLCYKYLFLYDFQFINSKASIGVLKKGFLNFQKHQFIGVLKK